MYMTVDSPSGSYVMVKNIHLLEDGTITLHVKGDNNGMVFTKQPIPVGTMFELTILEKNKSISNIKGVVS